MEERLIRLAKGAAVVAAGGALTSLTDYFAGLDLGLYGPVVTAVLAIAIDAVRHLGAPAAAAVAGVVAPKEE